MIDTQLLCSVREQFPIFQREGRPLIYLDTAATTHKPKRVIDAMTHFYLYQYGTVHRAIYELSVEATEMYDQARERVRRFINAKSDEEIVFTRGSTDGINLVSRSFGQRFLTKGDEVLVSETEHHSNLVPWQMLAKERGTILRFIPVNDRGEIILEELEKMLSSKVKLISIAHIYNTLGTINPVKKIIAMAHAYGVKVLIDGAQAAAHIPIDVQDIDADFYVFSGHKAYGPTGVGVLYGKIELLQEMPPVQGGGDMIEKVTLQESTYQNPPLRFEAGTPMFAEVIALKEALDFVDDIGLENIQKHEEMLLERALQNFSQLGCVKFYGTSSQKAPILCFNVQGIHPLDLGTFLDMRGVAIRTGHHCSHPTMKRFAIDACARISFGVYNTLEELEAFFAILSETVQKLKS
jgi:cysteine desulfurase / selenocysteine lyase